MLVVRHRPETDPLPPRGQVPHPQGAAACFVEESRKVVRVGGAQGAGGEAALRRCAGRPGGFDLPAGHAGGEDSSPGPQEKEGRGGR